MRSVNGIILAGGESTRMGVDKAMLTLGPYTFLEHLHQTLQPLCDQVLVIGPKRDLQNLNLTYHNDLYPDRGPLGGIYTGLTTSNKETNIILSCDAPLVDHELLQHLLDKHTHHLALFKGDGIWPFPGIYERALIPSLKKNLQSDQLKTINWVVEQDVQYVSPNQLQEEKLVNINTPQDYKNLLGNEIKN